MTKRTTTLVNISAATAALIFGPGRAAFADTLWDVLNKQPSAGKTDTLEPTQRPTTGKASPVRVAGNTPRRKRGGLLRFMDDMGDGLRQVSKKLNSEVKMEGTYTLGFHNENVSGSGDTYRSETYYGQSSLGGVSQTDVTLRGKLLGIFNFQTHYTNSPYGNPYDNRFSLNYENRLYKIDAGDITGTIQGNSLVAFSRTLKGVELGVQVFKQLHVTTLMSQTKAVARTITINGNNTSGPYYVYAGQIVDGSERVRVNNVDKVKGTDYTLDPYTGELQFAAGTIIHDTDSIAVTFETYGYDQSPGVLTGWRADLMATKGVNLGFTMLSQTNSAQKNTSSTYTDPLFQGQAADTLYPLRYSLAVKPTYNPAGIITQVDPVGVFVVKVNGVPQIYGQDYYLWPHSYTPTQTNEFKIRRTLAPTDTVEVTYEPIREDAAPGNRQVYGTDAKISLGSTGNIVAEMASSKLDVSGKSVGGSAWQLRSDLQFLKNRLHMNLALRDIGSNFTSIESAGFRVNDKGLTLGMDYAPNSAMKITSNFERTRRPSYSYSGSTTSSSALANVVGMDQYSSTNLGFTWRLGNHGQIALTHNGTSTNMATGGHTSLASDNLSLNYTLKSLSMDFNLGTSNADSLSYTANSSASGTTTAQYGSSSLTSRMNLRWKASDALSLAAVVAQSSSKASTGQPSQATDMSLTSEYSPAHNLKLSLGFQMQDSGSYGAFTNGGSTGSNLSIPDYSNYAGGGVNSGLGGYGNNSGGVTSNYGSYSSYSAAGKSKGYNLGVNYLPAQNMTLDFTYNASSSQGDYTLNSRRNDFTISYGYNLSERLSFNTSLANQKMTYIGSSGGTNSNMVFFTVRAIPMGRLTTNLSFQRMITSSSASSSAGSSASPSALTNYDTNMNSMSFRMEYPVMRRSSLYFQYDNSTTSGYAPSTMNMITSGLSFDLAQNMKFSLGWRQQNHNTLASSQGGGDYSYHVGSIDADFNMHF